MYVVIAYDIVDNRIRTKVAKRLTYYLHRVQKSVFEGQIKPALYDRMIAEVIALIDHTQDNIRIYHLCAHCRGQVRMFGRAFVPPGPDDDQVV